MDKNRTDSALLTLEQLAERLNVSRRTVENLVRAQRGPHFIRIGRAKRFRAEDIESWLAAAASDTSQNRKT